MKFLKIIAILMSAIIFLTACNGDDSKKTTTSISSSSIPKTENESSNQSEVSNVETSNSSVSSSQTIVNSTVPKPVQPTSLGEISAEKLSEIKKLSSKCTGWGQGLTFDNFNRPVYSLNTQAKYGKYGAYFIAQNEKKFYFTFDEGWENGYTDDILDTLKDKNVKAVFFVTKSYVKYNRSLVQRMIDEGHIVGHHSDKHINYGSSSLETVYNDFMSLHNYMLSEFQYEMTLFRYPEGSYNEQSLALINELGYKTLFWSFAYADWDVNSQKDESEALELLKKRTHNGAIYLLHCVSSTNANILGEYIDFLRSEGYSIELFPAN